MTDEVTATRQQLRTKVQRILALSTDLLYVLDNPREPLPDDNHVNHVAVIAEIALGAAIAGAKLAAYAYPPEVLDRPKQNVVVTSSRVG